MRNVKSNKLTKRIISYLMAVALIVSMVPFSAFITNAEPTPTMDGTFESGTLNATPDGWKIVAHKSWGGGDYNPTSDSPKNYLSAE